MKKKFIPIILGTDINSYSVAYSIFDAYKIKPIVCGTSILIPFYQTQIAEVYTKEGFSTNIDMFLSLINWVNKEKNPEGYKLIFYVPNERYLKILHEASKYFNFEFEIPYPDLKTAKLVANKSSFYKTMENYGIKVPKSRYLDKTNFKTELDYFEEDKPLFMKAESYEELEDSGIELIKKGYFEYNKKQALKDLLYLFEENSFDGKMIVQEYIEGGPGTEYSINGYRSKNDTFSFIQSRSLLSDTRPKWIGNHLVLIDSNIEKLYEISKDILRKLSYYGLFNFDFKIDSKTGDIFVLECNPRQGRSFYYGNLGGLNLIKSSIEDRIFNKSQEERQKYKFNWIVASDAINLEALDKVFLDLYQDEDRLKNSERLLENNYDRNLIRGFKIRKYLSDLDKIYSDLLL